MKRKTPGNASIDSLITALLEKATTETDMSTEDKLKILDRAIKNEALKAKLTDDGYGAGFDENDDD